MINNNVKYFSATEQIESISAKNVEHFSVPKKKENKISDYFKLIKSYDEKVVDNRHIYPDMLVQWKIEQLK